MQTFLPNMFYYGFPVVLLSTVDSEGNQDVTPVSCTWTLGNNAVIGLVKLNQAYENVRQVPEAVFNLPTAAMWQQVEGIARYTGKNPVPEQKAAKYTYTDNKFSIGGFTTLPSEKVKPLRIAECPIQAEAEVLRINERESYAIVELSFLTVHVADDLVMEGNKINPERWHPLIYNFKNYQEVGALLGKNFSIK